VLGLLSLLLLAEHKLFPTEILCMWCKKKPKVFRALATFAPLPETVFTAETARTICSKGEEIAPPTNGPTRDPY